ncbi:MAG TPA: carboxypeptidase-like regulatory domain-containing protein, partial [Armatimonadota bacterium]|nr:carboxypeptidase-like regulatory domain-containing protein [Armatimonadota bacterium]
NTHQPLAHVRVGRNLQRRSDEVVTDADGTFSFTCLPDKYQVSIRAFPAGYIRTYQQQVVEVKAGEAKDINLTAQKGDRYTGTVRDEQGNPLSGVTLQLKAKQNQQMSSCTTDAQGCFISALVPQGGVTFTMSSYWSNPSEWEVVSPGDVVAKTDKPIAVVLRKTPRGRVVSTHGDVLNGVQLAYSITRPLDPDNPQSSRNKSFGNTLSKTNGEYCLPALRHGDIVLIDSAICDGVRLATLGTVNETNGHFTVTDTIMTVCDASVHGQVLSPNGTPVAGALVFSSDGRPMSKTTTDAQGNFTLPNLPAGTVQLAAATRDATALQSVSTGNTPVNLSLRPVIPAASPDMARLIAWLRADATAPKDKQIFDHVAVIKALAAVDPNQAMAEITAEGLKITDDMRAAYLIGLVKRDPVAAAKTVPTELELIYDPIVRCDTALTVGMRLSESSPTIAEHCYALADGVLQGENVTGRLSRFLDRAVLAYCLHHQDAGQLFTALQPVIAEQRNWSTLGQIYAVTCLIAPEQSKAYLDKIDSSYNRWLAMTTATNYLLQCSPKLVGQLMPTLRAMEPNDFSNNTAQMFTDLSRSDLKSAQDYADSIKYDNFRYQALFYISRYQPANAALAFYKECTTKNVYNRLPAIVRGEMAARAYTMDNQLGIDMFAKFLDSLQSRSRGPQQNLLSYGYYYSAVDPAAARAMIEESYARTKETTKSSPWILVNYPMAMAIIDPDRAATMLVDMEQQGIPNQVVTQAATNLVNFLLATPQDRLTLFQQVY